MGRTIYQNLYLILFIILTPCLSYGQIYSFVTVDDTLGLEAYAISDSERIIEDIDSVMAAAISQEAFPGGVLYVSTSDSVLHFKAYGHHTYDSLKPVQRHHIYDLASVTKVTAATLSLMKLYDNGLLDLDNRVRDYVPGIGNNKRGNAQVRETLAHQAGWRPWIPYYQEMINEKGYKKRFFSTDSSANYPIKIKDDLYLTNKNYKYIKRQIRKSDFDENRGYAYSGLFFYLIPELVEIQTGQKFEAYLQDEIYGPLGCATTGFNPMTRFPDSLIVPTEKDTFFRQTQIHGTVHDEGAIVMGGVSGNAGLFSNAEDLARVWKMFLNMGQYDSLRLLSPQTVDLFTAAHYSGNDNRRGLGFDKPLLEYDSTVSSVAPDASFRSFGHSGYTGPLVWADPEHDLLFIFLANRVYPTRNQRKIYELGVRPTIHQYCYDLLKAYRDDL